MKVLPRIKLKEKIYKFSKLLFNKKKDTDDDVW